MRQCRVYDKLLGLSIADISSLKKYAGTCLMPLNKVNFNEGEYCSKDKDVYWEILPKAVCYGRNTDEVCGHHQLNQRQHLTSH